MPAILPPRRSWRGRRTTLAWGWPTTSTSSIPRRSSSVGACPELGASFWIRRSRSRRRERSACQRSGCAWCWLPWKDGPRCWACQRSPATASDVQQDHRFTIRLGISTTRCAGAGVAAVDRAVRTHPMARPGRSRGRPTTSKHPRKGSSAPAQAPAGTPEAQARLSELLSPPPQSVEGSGQAASDAVTRFSAVAAETPGGPLALIEVLGGSRDEAAGHVLAAVATAAPDREQRKAARRALHRLRSTGIAVALPVAAEPAPAASVPTETPAPIRAVVSPSDGVGSRLLWLLLERSHGGL